MLPQGEQDTGWPKPWLLRRIMLFGSWGVDVVILLYVAFKATARPGIDETLAVACISSMSALTATYVFGAAWENRGALASFFAGRAAGQQPQGYGYPVGQYGAAYGNPVPVDQPGPDNDPGAAQGAPALPPRGYFSGSD